MPKAKNGVKLPMSIKKTPGKITDRIRLIDRMAKITTTKPLASMPWNAIILRIIIKMTLIMSLRKNLDGSGIM